ncbi:MAG TPA: beta-N-acetylhexosaminidase [Terriglobales bacterium]|nr:beta-N-acetylhexosaminidase [Terriglobales bacterium]
MAKQSKQDLRTQVGQLLIMGFDGTEMSPKLRTMISTLQPGGVILFRRNIEAAQQTFDLVQECRKSIRVPVFTCVDLEGGTVDRLRDLIAPAPSVAEVVAAGNRKLFRKHGRLLGEESRAFGFNTDFAPVLDLRFEPSLSVLGSRTASANPNDTVKYARELLKGLKDSGVLGCGKHFPGLGEANLDTHHELPSINKPWKKLWKEDLLPYRELRKEMPFVMVAHAAYPDVTKDGTPASISKKWMSILRTKIGYKGLAISDDLEMGGVLKAAPIEEAARTTIEAGADIFLVCHNEEFVWRSYEAVLTTAEKDKKFAKRVAEASSRVIAFKKRSKALKWKPKSPSQKTIDKLRRAIWEFCEEIRLDTDAVRNA